MIGLVESGSTKAHWLFLEGKKVVYEVYTVGLNPHSASLDRMYGEVALVEKGIQKMPAISHLFFYGAGCHAQSGALIVENMLFSHFSTAIITVKSDLVAAGISIYGEGEGVVGILGTGSSCCYFSHGAVEHVAPSLGYILGDEGGGANLGREVLRAYTYNLLPAELSRDFLAAFPSDRIIADLYKSSNPAGYLAQFVPFLVSNIGHPFVQNLVGTAFSQYLRMQVLPICDKSKNSKIGIVGSVGALFSSILEPLTMELGLELTKVVQYPITALVEYHTR
ncbi:MAG TPA: hypothetical protein VMV56_07975 [Williamwhitmania sp.]|nr:hypothetical protein [Williamwhitmania sp.]